MTVEKKELTSDSEPAPHSPFETTTTTSYGRRLLDRGWPEKEVPMTSKQAAIRALRMPRATEERYLAQSMKPVRRRTEGGAQTQNKAFLVSFPNVQARFLSL